MFTLACFLLWIFLPYPCMRNVEKSLQLLKIRQLWYPIERNGEEHCAKSLRVIKLFIFLSWRVENEKKGNWSGYCNGISSDYAR